MASHRRHSKKKDSDKADSTSEAAAKGGKAEIQSRAGKPTLHSQQVSTPCEKRHNSSASCYIVTLKTLNWHDTSSLVHKRFFSERLNDWVVL